MRDGERTIAAGGDDPAFRTPASVRPSAPPVRPPSDLGTPRCPRCGYDVRAVTGTWTSSCPLLGTCAECGLRFPWCEVLRPEKFEPRWLVEFAPVSAIAPSAIRTAWRSLRPRRFWSSLRMTQPLRVRRIGVYWILLALTVVACYAVEQTAVATRVRFELGRSPVVASVQHSYGAAILEAVLTPGARTSSGSVRFALRRGGARVTGYPAPARLHREIQLWSAGFPLRRLERFVRRCGGFWLGAAAVYALMPAAFVLLPVSRRRANVRRGHLLRIGAYSALFPFLAAALFFLVFAAGFAWTTLLPAAPSLGGAIGAIALPLCLVEWWATAIRRHLHMPHGYAVAVLLTLMCALLVLAAAHFTVGVI